MPQKIKIIDENSSKKNNGFYVEPDGEFLKVTKEQKDGIYTMQVYLFDANKVQALTKFALEKRKKKSIIEKVLS